MEHKKKDPMHDSKEVLKGMIASHGGKNTYNALIEVFKAQGGCLGAAKACDPGYEAACIDGQWQCVSKIG